ncbi:MAG: hypothetical protein R3F24_00770 [Gammaproteobacteria bacterium]
MKFSEHHRLALAAEAARIIQEEGLTDYRGAKEKAAIRLGYGREAPLPNNGEIEAALAERTRIFHADTHPVLLEAMRLAASAVMRDLAGFHPRLTGDTLSGNVTEHSLVELHLFDDAAEAVGSVLDTLGISYKTKARRFRLRRDAAMEIPGYQFIAHDCLFAASVFPLRLRGHAPLSPVDGRPMNRASLKELSQLLDPSAERSL